MKHYKIMTKNILQNPNLRMPIESYTNLAKIRI